MNVKLPIVFMLSGMSGAALAYSQMGAGSPGQSPAAPSDRVVASQATCTALVGRSIGGASIISAKPVPSGTTLDSQFGGSATITRPMCRVMGRLQPTSDSDIRFEVWLPSADDWNHHYQAIGGGGNAGSFSLGAIGRALDTGYAASGQDNGHVGNMYDSSYAVGHPEKVQDFGWRSLHLVAVASKAVIAAYYGARQDLSLFNGCSTGGRQALDIAQRFPDDYDGISAGAAANYWPALNALSTKFGKYLVEHPEAWVSPEKLAFVQAAVLKSCGGVNGVIDDVRACRFDYESLRCSGADKSTCLTAPELAGLKARFADLDDDHGKLIYPGFSPGLETSLGRTWFGPTRETRWSSSVAGPIVERFFRDYVHQNPSWNIRQFDVESDLRAAQDGAIGRAVAAEDPDLTPFMKRGGKLIQWHGWQDMSIPARNSVRYYGAVQQRMGASRVDGFYKLFMAPGVDHCGGGPGPDSIGQNATTVPGADADHDVMAALVRWIKQGKAPSYIVATKFAKDGSVVAQRPWCPYPAVARWDGKGSRNEASSYSCSRPTT